jgi:hypothetical protein
MSVLYIFTIMIHLGMIGNCTTLLVCTTACDHMQWTILMQHTAYKRCSKFTLLIVWLLILRIIL